MSDPALETPFEMARRLELCSAWRSRRYAEAYQKLHPDAAVAILPFDGAGQAVYIHPGSPLNAATGLGFAGQVPAETMDALETFYHARGAPVRLHVCPLADPSLLALVRARGYRLASFFSVLARHIPDGFSPQPLPPGMTVTRALPEQAALWVSVSAMGFAETDDPPAGLLDLLGPNFAAQDAAPFFAWMEGQPAAGGGMYAAPHVRALELGGASTRLPFRRRGAQAALIEARLAEGLRAGCDLVMVLATPGSHSQRNLQRLGFQVVYSKVVMTLDPHQRAG
jgi:hypothetical protein